MRSSRAVIVASLVVVAAYFAFPQRPASAGTQNGSCEANEWCVFKDANSRGCVFDWEWEGTMQGGMEDDYINCKGQQLKDSVSSYQNHTPGWLIMWEHPDYKGFRYCVAPGGSGNMSKSFNDRASSIGNVDPEDFARGGGEAKCNSVDRD